MTTATRAFQPLGLAVSKNRARVITLLALVVVLFIAIQGMSTEDWVLTLLRGLTVAAVTFLVASGFSLIFGLMDVLNLAHGTLFMVGAYIGWTAYIRVDTAIDLLTPACLLAAGLVLAPIWQAVWRQLTLSARTKRVLSWLGIGLGLFLFSMSVVRYPITMWDPAVYEKSPVIFGTQLDMGILTLPEPRRADASVVALCIIGMLLGSSLFTFAWVGFTARSHVALRRKTQLPLWTVGAALALVAAGISLFVFNDSLTDGLFQQSTTWRFLFAVVVATGAGAAVGALMESTLIRPLYTRPIYQLMLTLGLAVIGREIVVAIWGRTLLLMPKPALFNGTGPSCPAIGLDDWLANHCSTISFMGSRVRSYSEIFVVLVGIVVLIVVWVLLQRSRIGMVIRAGVQDREMVEALGIDVRRVFTLVFALGVALAALGGVLAGPATGVSDDMGESLLLLALIALAVGGLTSFPGAAVGSLIVGILQQFIVKYGQIGIKLPFIADVLKPTPPLVPASTVLLMVIILLLMPQGLFGRKE